MRAELSTVPGMGKNVEEYRCDRTDEKGGSAQ